MPTIGRACHELRVRDGNVTWRIIYAIDVDAIVVLDVFAKRSGKTPGDIVSNCKRRLRMFKGN